MGEPAIGTWWLVAFLFTRVEAFSQESMVGCHELLARMDAATQVSSASSTTHRARTTELLAPLPLRLREMIELDVVVAVTCIDGETLAEMTGAKAVQRGYSRLPTTPYRDGDRELARPLPRLPAPPREALPHDPVENEGLMKIPFNLPSLPTRE